MTVQERIADNAKRNAGKISEVNVFGKSMPPGFDTDGVLNDGDIIEMPTTIDKVFKRIFGKNSDGSDNYGEYIVVNVVDKDGKPRAVDFYPSSLMKNIWKAEKRGEIVETILEGGPLNPKGTAVEAFTAFRGKGTEEKTDTQLGVEALLGKKIKVSEVAKIDTQVWRNGAAINSTRKQRLFNYDLVA